ncbi:hypothetical protein F383_13044 [Gossypium arboreum]|uniref:Uncharacterized protein n=1 Tax=Gossypium arboreum TaxID=29729 RepID=A0A0B0PRV0_GOSAR|nr:hypothetical protein F383_13044 [Gossypium arboreum]
MHVIGKLFRFGCFICLIWFYAN